MLAYGVRAAFICLEPEPTQFGPSQSWLWDLGLPSQSRPKSGGSATLAQCTGDIGKISVYIVICLIFGIFRFISSYPPFLLLCFDSELRGHPWGTDYSFRKYRRQME